MRKTLIFAWAGMFVLCAALGFIQPTSPIINIALTIICVVFFIPATLLLYNAIAEDDQKTVRVIRWISLGSLLATTVALVINIVCGVLYAAGIAAPQSVTISYTIMVIVSSPMCCGTFKALSLFLWACLLFSTLLKKDSIFKKKK